MASSLLMLIETVAGPMNWRLDRSRGHRSYLGRFLVYDQAGLISDYVRGRIDCRDGHSAEVYLYDPPAYLKKHSHGRCLQLLSPGSGWFKLHFEKPAYSFADAYSFVELLLTEAFTLAH